MLNIGFLSFGWWSGAPGSRVRTASELMHDTIRLAEAAEDAALDGAWIRIHHYEQNTSSPFPLLAAMGARTSRVELGTGVINMRYENPLYMAEAAGTADLIAGGRLQLGVSRGSPEPAADGPGTFGYPLPVGKRPVEDAAERIAKFRDAISGTGIAEPGANAHVRPGTKLAITPQSPGLTKRIWYGAGGEESARTVGELGMNLMSSTLVEGGTGEPLGVIQSRQIDAFRSAWADARHEGVPRVSVSRSIQPIVDDETALYFGPTLERDRMGANRDQVGSIDTFIATFGKTYVGDLDKLERELRDDEAVMSSDTLLVTIPNQLGADFNHRTFFALKELRDRLAPHHTGPHRSDSSSGLRGFERH
ncbi:LLM class flavin-dependent oxidoreductase [Demequina muriae]|uniref:LLM class flavin-dependent oxidoreductase n=1 Tax=Demequina muriae TaxID=3051664 RepID=A0ABT8GG01_9MICO|nr:LLM class flavin-dependent oxidoreductase [Demequina sp. EGI L300058]MDN4480368.1 LLM class flavin-dependent oxidoreductase [Demequina sp. EGI L300058]